MTDPRDFDEDGWIESELGRGDQNAFEELFKKKFKNIDEDRAQTARRRRFEDSDKEQQRLFKAIVDSFSPKDVAMGSDSGFEITIVNPLYELDVNSTEILLAKRQPRSVHVCFVSCEIGGEDSARWRSDINRVATAMEKDEFRTALKRHLSCSNLPFKSIQYITITRELDLADVDLDVLKIGTTPDNYAVWKLVETELPEEIADERGEEDQIIKHHDGHIEHPDLLEVAVDGIDYSLVNNDDIRYSLTSHPIFPIGDTLLRVYLHQEPASDYPDEFNQSLFSDTYRSGLMLGNDRRKIEKIVNQKVGELLDLALDADMIEDEDGFDTDRDYRILWQSDDEWDIKDMVRNKYFKYKAPEERGKLALERAKDEFEKSEKSLDDY